MSKINVLLCGFGQLGKMLYRDLKNQPDINVAGVYDHDPSAGGKDAGECASGTADGMIVGTVLENIDFAAVDAALVTTVSGLSAASGLICRLLEHGIKVVSSCEELFYPLDPVGAARLDQTARQYGAAVVGCGINPGFLMDYFPSVLSAASLDITKVEISRVQNAAVRRMQFQKKIGAGCSQEEFEKLRKSGVLRHVGLRESVAFLGRKLGWDLDEITETIAPVVSETDYDIPGAVPVRAGEVRGVRQLGLGWSHGRTLIRLEFLAAIGEPESFDRVHICGKPEIESTIRGGLNGDSGSCAVLINTVRAVVETGKCGLLSLADLPVLGGRGV